ncbi:helix-turn-helix domain-containing protein [Utexia brackfieldae]|uniref:winged helix-turn-helix transcriptional regulator n=1 Tax=Utexia brackfieldae TaxID=3074108 RepID=UPI00370D7CA3
MLKMWGIYHAYTSRCGYQRINAVFKALYPTKTYIFIENDINFIDECMWLAKKSLLSSLREQQKIAELYYKGIDVVAEGSDWSEHLSIRDIADTLGMSKSTVDRRLKAFESYIISKSIKVNF